MSFPRWLLALIAINTLAVIISSVWHLATAQTLASEEPLRQNTSAGQVTEPSNAVDDKQRFLADPPTKDDQSQKETQTAGEDEQSAEARDSALAKREDVASDASQDGTDGDAPTLPIQQSARIPSSDRQPGGDSNVLLEELATPSLPGTQPPPLAPRPSLPAEVPSLATQEELEKDPIFQEFQNMFDSSGVAPSSEESFTSDTSSEAYFESLRRRLSSVQQITKATDQLVDEAQRLHRQGRKEQSEAILRMTVNLREIAAELLVSEL